jgi:hypothetical protein
MKVESREAQVTAKRKVMRGEMFRIVIAMLSVFTIYGSQYLLQDSQFLARFFGVVLFIVGYQILLWTAGIRLEILGTDGGTSKI